MITTQLLRPESIVVVGASNNVHKPGGAILKNLINGGYRGELRAVNPKEKEVQGVPAFADVNDLPDTDLAVLAVPASMCPDMVETLASKKQTRAFIILSAGFGEETHEGALLEERILETVNKYGASLIGPNCIGLMNTWHHSVFSQPIPNLNPKGVDLISSSGATAVFILERAVTKCLHTLSQPSFVFYFVSFASVSFLAGSSLAVSSGAFSFASLVAMPFFLAASNVSVLVPSLSSTSSPWKSSPVSSSARPPISVPFWRSCLMPSSKSISGCSLK